MCISGECMVLAMQDKHKHALSTQRLQMCLGDGQGACDYAKKLYLIAALCSPSQLQLCTAWVSTWQVFSSQRNNMQSMTLPLPLTCCCAHVMLRGW